MLRYPATGTFGDNSLNPNRSSSSTYD